MNLRRAAAVSVVLPLLLVTACSTGSSDTGATGGDSSDGGGLFTSNVDVDTAQLRQAKKQAGIEPCEPGTGDAVEGGLPDLTLPCLGGGPDVDLGSLRGPLVVNLWAQWCGPCREELPYYQQLHEQADGTVEVLGVDWMDTQPARAIELARESGVTYPLLADPAGSTKAPLGVRGLPGVIFVDADGNASDPVFVVIRSYDQLRDLVEQHLDVKL